jgi:FkbM family methyltransferase
VIHAAVGNREGGVELIIDRNNSMARTVGEHLRYIEPFQEEARVTVDCITIDSLAVARSLRRIDLLKIDVEGFEVECLQGARAALSTTDRVIVEVHGEALRLACWRLLEERGFAIEMRGTLMFARRRTPTS